jgi:hypothetical protein
LRDEPWPRDAMDALQEMKWVVQCFECAWGLVRSGLSDAGTADFDYAEHARRLLEQLLGSERTAARASTTRADEEMLGNPTSPCPSGQTGLWTTLWTNREKRRVACGELVENPVGNNGSEIFFCRLTGQFMIPHQCVETSLTAVLKVRNNTPHMWTTLCETATTKRRDPGPRTRLAPPCSAL